MKSRWPLLLPLILGGILAGLLLMVLPRDWTAGWDSPGAGRTTGSLREPWTPPAKEPEKNGSVGLSAADFALAGQWADAGEKILAMLEKRLNVEGARKNEALLSFKSEEAYREFLKRAAGAGLRVLDQLDGMRTVRVGYDDLGALQGDLLANARDYGDVSANYYAYIPDTPTVEERAAQNEVPFGDQLLAYLGLQGDTSQYGKGVKIAILDSGVGADATFGTGRMSYIDIGQGITGTAEGDGHGTAVASLALGQSADAMGIAPGAEGLSIRVTGVDGTSDLFTLAKGIQTAVDAGAQVINISLGAYQNSSLLTQAIDYAISRGSVVVAAAGNDQAAQMTWPAADPRVVSVGSIDALEQQSTFSNSGEGLSLTAPGYGLNTAWLNGERVVFDGTSGSAPVVAGSIAAVMSFYPGITAAQAVQVLETYSSDGGAPGADNAYGKGILNLGWALKGTDPQRIDTAVSSHYYNNQTGQMEFVVQNRSGQAVSGMSLYINSDGNQTSFQIPVLAAGASTVVGVPVDRAVLQQSEGISYRSQLLNPSGVLDAVPSNNSKGSVVVPNR